MTNHEGGVRIAGVWALALCLVGMGCSAGDARGRKDDIGDSASALVATSDDVLGFETPSGWSTRDARLASTTTRTQGAAALQIDNPIQLSKLTSKAVASTAAALAHVGDDGASFAIDVMPPKPPPNTSSPGALQMFVTSPSLGLTKTGIGQADFTGLKPDLYSTVKFPIPAALRAKLSSKAFSDLTIELDLHTPGLPGKVFVATYRFDNLRVHSPSNAPAGVHQSVDLVALRTYSPPSNSPGSASFTAGIVQVPASFHVKSGSAGTGSATLELGYGSTARVTCTYAGAQNGTAYDFASCTGGALKGDLLGADFARLTIVSGASAAGPTKVRAQLALNPVGDVAGTGVIPPMPTFWGDTPDGASQIVTAYFDAVHATPPQEQIQITTPVPEFARRHGDGSPFDNLSGQPRPANPLDPPFDQEGHLNEGGNWDAYWRLAGEVTPTRLADNRFQNHFAAELSANAVLWGHDASLVSVKAQADSDSGEVSAQGLNQPTASGSVKLYLAGIEIVSKSVTPEKQFSFDESVDHTFTIASVQIWIFNISLKARVAAGFTASGTITPVDVAFQVTPTGSVSAIVEGGVNVVIASGTVAAEVDLLRLSTPVLARATWFLSTEPTNCAARLFVSISGDATLSSLGGKVDLKATVGSCPFCYQDSYNLFTWDPLASKHYDLFDVTLDGQLFPLPAAACVATLNVTIDKPVANESVAGGVPYTLQGSAVRPATPGVDPETIDCTRLTWTSSDASDTAFPVNGCTPQVTFGNAGSRTLTLSATAASGETGSTTRSFTVVAPPTGPAPFITTPHEGDVFGVYSCYSGPVSLTGGSVGGTGNVGLKWTIVPISGGGGPLTITDDTSSSATLNLPQGSGGQQPTTYQLTLTATDEASLSNSTSINIITSCFL
jgi:hypothetical protein